MRLRRNDSEPRIELIPLIDVMCFLLTFFFYSFAFMARIELVPMELRKFTTGVRAEPKPAATVSIDLQGRVFFNREAINLDDLRRLAMEAKAAKPETVIYVAVADGQGSVDRAPVLQDVWDRLKDVGMPVNIVGKPRDDH
ncbi:MAG: biopolymer transporter ExbD [Phycisphaerales bacterium]|nr:biopolymer transporter ExbD [Phycisphaerales bacterium]